MLRSEDVADKTFTTTRLREGYEIGEVDCFRIDVVEALAQRDRVIGELREELAALRAQPADGAPVDVVAPVVDEDAGSPDAGRRESSAAAARLLELATVNADRVVADAKAEAARLTAELARERDELLAEIADLRQLESEHRSFLRGHFADQLTQLEAAVPAAPLTAVSD